MSVELLTLEDIESSKVYVSDTGAALSFSHPLDYLAKYLEILQPLGASLSFQGETGSISKDRQNEEFEEQEKHIAYRRLIAKAKLPVEYDINIDTESAFNHLSTEVGIVYSLEGKAPELRAYKGKRVTVCTNGCIFGANNVTSINLAKSSTSSIYDQIAKYVDTAANDYIAYKEIIDRLQSKELAGSKLMQRIGEIHWACKRNPKLGTTCANDMVTYLQDNKSKYGLVGDKTNDWILYNACTESLKKSNMLDEHLKVFLLERVFNNN